MSFPKWALSGLALLFVGCEPPQIEQAVGPGTKTAAPKPLMEQAADAANEGRLDESVKLLERVVAAEPKNRDALWMLAQVAQGRAAELKRHQSSVLYLKSSDAMRKLKAASKALTPEQTAAFQQALYNEVCTYAVEDRIDHALKSLDEAVAAGFHGADLLESDPELDPLRKSPKFQEIKAQVETQARAEGRAEAEKLLADNRPFPFEFKLPNLNGKPTALADVKGKVTIVDVWGTWCGPCRREVPEFIKLYNTYHDKGLVIVGLNYERDEAEDKARAAIKSFITEHQVPYPCLIGDEATQKQIPAFGGFPTTLFLDRAGTVRAKLVGYDPDHAYVLEALVTALLNETDK